VGLLAEHTDADWSVAADTIEWSCRTTLTHLVEVTVHWCARVAVRSDDNLVAAVDVADDATVDELLGTFQAFGEVLASVVGQLGPDERAFHNGGRADASGWAAMFGCEVAVHAGDICGGLGVPNAPDVFDPTAASVVQRLFPWATGDEPAWDRLLWATGRRSLDGFPAMGSEWIWHAAPLAEWDGTVPVWTPETDAPTRRARPTLPA